MPNLSADEMMCALASGLDDALNGEAKGKDRKIGFVLLTFPFETPDGRVHYIGNGERETVRIAIKELLARWEGRYAEPPNRIISMTTPNLTSRIADALEGVTEGPWEWDGGRLLHDEPGHHSDTILLISEEKWMPAKASRAFIASARTLLPESAAEIERLRSVIGRIDSHNDSPSRFDPDIDDLCAEVLRPERGA